MATDDKQLIAECLAGQTEAFGRLVVRYQDRLFNSLSRILGSYEDAHDVAQEAFVHAFQKLRTFQGNSAFYSWLFRIALNAAASRRRRSGRHTASIDQAREMTGAEPVDLHPASPPSARLELRERQQLVRRALALVPEEFRTPLVLKEIDGCKYEQIAEIIDCPIGTVRSRIHRARQELRRHLASLLRQEELSHDRQGE